MVITSPAPSGQVFASPELRLGSDSDLLAKQAGELDQLCKHASMLSQPLQGFNFAVLTDGERAEMGQFGK